MLIACMCKTRIPIYLTQDTKTVACATRDAIVVGKKFFDLDFLDQNFVLFHEEGHIVHGDCQNKRLFFGTMTVLDFLSKINIGRWKSEFGADLYALSKCSEVPSLKFFSACNYDCFSHPSSNKRIQVLNYFS